MPKLEFDLPKTDQSIIKVIGVGGGGSNAVNHMFLQGIIGVDFAICNTDNQALDLSPVPTKIQLGPGLTDGRGAGSKPEVGKHACLESIEDVQLFLNNGTKMLFVTAGMGGGTGTGAAPIIAKAAKEMGILTVGIVTVPFAFEGRLRQRFAVDGIEEMKRNVDSLIVISNDKLRDIYGNLAISAAFKHADDILTTAARGIAEIITVAGYINVDFEDVNTVMRDSGVAIMGSASAEGEDRARRAVDAALNSPLLEDNNISGAQNILLNITSGTKEVTMDEIYEINEFVQAEAGMNTNIIWGNCSNEALGEKISVTLIASGFDKSRKMLHDHTVTPNIVSLDDEKVIDFSFKTTETKEMQGQLFEFGKNDLRTTAETYSNTQFSDPYIDTPSNHPPERKPVYDEMSARNDYRKQIANARLSNVATIVELENTPAYIRRKVVLEDVPHSSEQNLSRWSISQDNELDIRNDNPFLRGLAD
ncbi:MAG TPA: cell division protein FtsZ [Saprospiraceae bacterium]|nr:cell division protein FtsZ [Saprospiraceae bacterium]HQW57229.1 cell division protein FtsZ [Saprospiraceae bacterium]